MPVNSDDAMCGKHLECVSSEVRPPLSENSA